MKDIIFQIQTIAGCMVRNIIKSNFVTNGGVITNTYTSGDYTQDSFVAIPNDADLGTVVIKNGNTVVPSGTEVAKGTTLTLTATPAQGKTFKKWSTGQTAATINIVTTGDPMYFTAIFSGE